MAIDAIVYEFLSMHSKEKISFHEYDILKCDINDVLSVMHSNLRLTQTPHLRF